MAKSTTVKTGLRSLAVMISFSAILVAASCDAFGPPFVFGNPYDPDQEFRLLGSIGRPIFSDGGGLGDDPLGFLDIRCVAIDLFVEPHLLYVLDASGAIQMIDLETRGFVGFFGPRGEEAGAINNPWRIFFSPDAVYVNQDGNVNRYTRSGEFAGTVADDAPSVNRFVIRDGYFLSSYYTGSGFGLFVKNITSGQSDFFPDFVSGHEVVLEIVDGEVVAVYADQLGQEIVIGTIDLPTISFTETGRLADSAIRFEHDGYAISGSVTTPHGFLWLLNSHGVALRTDRNGTVHRTVFFDRDRFYRGAAADPNGRIYFGARDRIDVYGAR